jgi:integrase
MLNEPLNGTMAPAMNTTTLSPRRRVQVSDAEFQAWRASRRRRHRCAKHRGVTLVDHPTGWQGRWTDPQTKKQASLLLHRLGLTREEACCRWAAERRATLRVQREQVNLYGTVRVDLTVIEAVSGFVSTKKAEGLRLASVKSLRDRLRPLVDWCGSRGLERLNLVTVQELAAFREHVLRLPARKTKGGPDAGRGAKVMTDNRLSGTTRRGFLAAADYFMRERSALPADLIRKALKPNGVKVERKPIVFLDTSGDIRKTIEAAMRHDRSNGRRPVAAPLILAALLAGLRRGEMKRLDWKDVDLDGNGGKGLLRLDESTKTKRPRRVALDVCPVLRGLLAALRLRAGNPASGPVFPEASFLSFLRRLRCEFGAPARFTWQVARRTCAAWSCSAPGVFGAASAFMSAKRLGHGVGVSERFYADSISGIPATAKTLEAAMGIEDLTREVVVTLQSAVRARRVS